MELQPGSRSNAYRAYFAAERVSPFMFAQLARAAAMVPCIVLTSSVGLSGESSFSGAWSNGLMRSKSPVMASAQAFLNGQPGTGFRLKIDGVGPVQQGRHLAAHEQKQPFSSIRCAARDPGHLLDRMLDRFSDKTILLVPLRSAAMKLGQQKGKLVFKALPEHIGKKMVVPIPFPFVDKSNRPFRHLRHRPLHHCSYPALPSPFVSERFVAVKVSP